ncbi:flagellar biosynthesis anti-sigma factor FlgM [Endozoicomonas sp. SM1973]|uniref:Negative regulator of flagellin synthesis n=1 Tax=Spartinivicinus marinus TaxID=2994442 RepID=A0A853IDV1_9GAMM|nr:flagellar biosynthesis anti-sigma factor FlgM [Spartinivicinus marinus]MCX4024777.1 flagellar biosynthesis anti-sigma factor FlgM [Spartinivicinus marinus]NYZ68728.1 flagellar biosynthesis anti-sigma factor FlgM [Spartinivicinus marinus]
MVNDVNGASGQQSSLKSAQAKPAEKAAKSTLQPQSEQNTQPPKQVSVELSAEAKQLQKLQQKASQEPQVDEQKVARIRAALAEGSYSVNPEKIADKLFELESLLR